MQLKPQSEILKLSKEKAEEFLAPTRARLVRAPAEVEIAKLEGKSAGLEKQIQEACVSKELNFQKITDLMDDLALNARKVEQLNTIVAQLFPEKKK